MLHHAPVRRPVTGLKYFSILIQTRLKGIGFIINKIHISDTKIQRNWIYYEQNSYFRYMYQITLLANGLKLFVSLL
jgi:hypothetical protein